MFSFFSQRRIHAPQTTHDILTQPQQPTRRKISTQAAPGCGQIGPLIALVETVMNRRPANS
jgi:hypothetical protein